MSAMPVPRPDPDRPGSGGTPEVPTEADDGLRLERLGTLLRYPGAYFSDTVETARLALAGGDPEAAEELERFADGTRGLVNGGDVRDLQELYTRTFDLNPVCALEVGWHLYGENYERGRFMVRMRELLVVLGIEEAVELPDHLTSMLPALARLDDEDAGDLSRRYVLPAVGRMLDGFDDAENPYVHLVRAVERTLRAAFGEPAEDAGTGVRHAPHHRRRRNR